MRILHLTTFLQGGAGRVIVDLALQQQAGGDDVTVVTSESETAGYGNYPAYLSELAQAGVRLERVDSLFHRDYAQNLAVVRRLHETFAPGREPDVAHAHAAIPSLIGRLFAGGRSSPIPIVQTMHGWGVAKTRAQAVVDVEIMNLVDAVVAPSSHSAELLASLGVDRSRVTVVPYGTRTTRPAADPDDAETLERMARARRDGGLVVACIGTFGGRKNQTLLVDALARLDPAAAVFCVFVGDGDARTLRARIRAAGVLSARIHGYSRSARAIAAAADLVVLPSKSEGQPLTLLEAFRDGTLVAVSDIPELTELVEDGVTGLTFRAADADALAAALTRARTMTGAAREAIRIRARRRHAERFTLDAMTSGYRQIYDAVRHRRAASRRPNVSPAA
jgi:glycosyltransferase involved in cell wall biosynthesis